MTRSSSYTRKSKAHSSVNDVKARVETLETVGGGTTFQPLAQPTVIQELTFQFQSTQFTRINAAGNGRVYSNSAPSAIDEETLASVAAYATFDDVGGSGTGTPSPFPGGGGGASPESFTTTSFTTTGFTSESIIIEGGTGVLFRVPMEDNEGKQAFYHGEYHYIAWNPYRHPTVAHQNQFMRSNSVELNVPGTNSDDTSGFCYYTSNAAFDVSASFSVSLWFYPTDVSQISSEVHRYLLYRRIDANNYFIATLDSPDSTHPIRVFIREGGTETKLKDGTGNHLLVNDWNLLNFTYNPSTNALVLYLNGTAYTDVTTTVLSPVYTTDANMYIGGLPTTPAKRFTGYMDNFVFWTGKILTAGEVTNMWTRGTIT
jgi:Concanavalin A-like lectin/glucanases superfamily